VWGCSESDGNINGLPYFTFSWAPTLGDLGMDIPVILTVKSLVA